MKEKRRDNKGRILHTGESQRTDGKYYLEISRTFCQHLSECQYGYRARADALAIRGGHNVHFVT